MIYRSGRGVPERLCQLHTVHLAYGLLEWSGMPFQSLDDFPIPPDETIVWRYMDLTKFLLMLEQKSLYFASIRELTDPWEASLSVRFRASIGHGFGSRKSRVVVKLFNELRYVFGVNCWHLGEHESVAMWNLYTTNSAGVAIRSTVGRLKDAFKGSSERVVLGQVTYEDHSASVSDILSTPKLNALTPMLQKRPCFQHERELRILTELHSADERSVFGREYVVESPRKGKLVQVDLAALVTDITTGPAFFDWSRPLLETALTRHHLAVPVHSSMVQALPEPTSPES